MPAWPDFQLPPNSVISVFSIESLSIYGTSPAFAVYPSAQFGIYVPFRVAQPVTPTSLVWYNGATVSGTVDMAIYDTDFNKIVSTGATTQAGASNLQTASITQRSLGPGLFFWGIVLSSATATLARVAMAAELMAAVGCYQQAIGADVLPQIATPAHCTQAYLPALAMVIAPRTVV